MRHGLLLEEAPRPLLFRNPLHPYTRSLLGAVPTMQTALNQPLATLAPAAPSAPSSDSAPPPPLREVAPQHWARID
jgi:ABC-type dipeptide/oligopeptide/nickel transport system ATPase component